MISSESRWDWRKETGEIVLWDLSQVLRFQELLWSTWTKQATSSRTKEVSGWLPKRSWGGKGGIPSRKGHKGTHWAFYTRGIWVRTITMSVLSIGERYFWCVFPIIVQHIEILNIWLQSIVSSFLIMTVLLTWKVLLTIWVRRYPLVVSVSVVTMVSRVQRQLEITCWAKVILVWLIPLYNLKMSQYRRKRIMRNLKSSMTTQKLMRTQEWLYKQQPQENSNCLMGVFWETENTCDITSRISVVKERNGNVRIKEKCDY